jgi:5-methylcytosine-specific restriction endonuclease McrA
VLNSVIGVQSQYAAIHSIYCAIVFYALIRRPDRLLPANVREIYLRRTLGHTSVQWQALKKQYGWRCVACLMHAPNLEKGHIVPRVRGGNDHIKNLQPLCRSCNARQGTKIIDYRVDFQDRLRQKAD